MAVYSCPICGTLRGGGRSTDRDSVEFECPRCGPFEITGTALSMLKSRLAEDPRAVARASHAIRTQTSEEKSLEIDSTLVDSLVSHPLPSVQRQIENLISWVKGKVKDAQLASVKLPLPGDLEAIVGAADAGSLGRLLKWAEELGVIEFANGSSEARLTPKAWEGDLHEAKPQAEPTKDAEEPKIEKGHCPKCGPDRHADIVATHEDRWDDDTVGIWAIDTYNILKCRGCLSVYLKHHHVFSEDFDYEDDPLTGKGRPVLNPTITYWPAPAQRRRPEWLDKLQDHTLKQLLDEVYLALDGDQRVLAAIGARTALDRAMVLVGADETHNFPGKLEALQSDGVISSREKDNLLVLTDAGGAAAHRGWRPEPDELAIILDHTEAFLQRALVLGSAVEKMKASVPPRRKRPKKRGA